MWRTLLMITGEWLKQKQGLSYNVGISKDKRQLRETDKNNNFLSLSKVNNIKSSSLLLSQRQHSGSEFF